MVQAPGSTFHLDYRLRRRGAHERRLSCHRQSTQLRQESARSRSSTSHQIRGRGSRPFAHTNSRIDAEANAEADTNGDVNVDANIDTKADTHSYADTYADADTHADWFAFSFAKSGSRVPARMYGQ